MQEQGERLGFIGRLRAAYESNDLAMLLELTRALALEITDHDVEATDAALDTITDHLLSGGTILNYPAWARYVIRATASKVWRDRNLAQRQIRNLDECENVENISERWLPKPGRKRKEYVNHKDRLSVRIVQMREKGKTHKQIAKALGITENASMLRLSRLRKRFYTIT